MHRMVYVHSTDPVQVCGHRTSHPTPDNGYPMIYKGLRPLGDLTVRSCGDAQAVGAAACAAERRFLAAGVARRCAGAVSAPCSSWVAFGSGARSARQFSQPPLASRLYQRVVADFSEWVAQTHGHGDAMPAQVAAVCTYVAHLAKTRRNSTIPSYVAVVDASNVGLGALRLREQPGGALTVLEVERVGICFAT